MIISQRSDVKQKWNLIKKTQLSTSAYTSKHRVPVINMLMSLQLRLLLKIMLYFTCKLNGNDRHYSYIIFIENFNYRLTPFLKKKNY